MGKLVEGIVGGEGAVGLRRPGRVLADVGGEDVRDRGSVGDGFLRDPTQRIDASDADGDVVIRQLRNGGGEPVGELALSAQP